MQTQFLLHNSAQQTKTHNRSSTIHCPVQVPAQVATAIALDASFDAALLQAVVVHCELCTTTMDPLLHTFISRHR